MDRNPLLACRDLIFKSGVIKSNHEKECDQIRKDYNKIVRTIPGEFFYADFEDKIASNTKSNKVCEVYYYNDQLIDMLGRIQTIDLMKKTLIYRVNTFLPDDVNARRAIDLLEDIYYITTKNSIDVVGKSMRIHRLVMQLPNVIV